MAHYCKCYICGEKFDRDTIPAVQVSARRYAHATCVDNSSPEAKEAIEQQRTKDEFFQYIAKLYPEGYNYVKINTQAETYTNPKGPYKYTWNGIKKALIYFYDVLSHDPKDYPTDTIGIVPYIYRDAKEYYWRIFHANQKAKKIKDYSAKVKEFTIPLPQPKRKKHFIDWFDDKEE